MLRSPQFPLAVLPWMLMSYVGASIAMKRLQVLTCTRLVHLPLTLDLEAPPPAEGRRCGFLPRPRTLAGRHAHRARGRQGLLLAPAITDARTRISAEQARAEGGCAVLVSGATVEWGQGKVGARAGRAA